QLDLDARLGDPFADDALVGERPAKGDAALDPRAHRLERALGEPDHPHAMMDAAGTQPALRDLEAAPFAEEDVFDRYPHILELDLGVAVRRVVVAEHRKRTNDGDPRGVARYQDHRLLLVAGCVRVGLAHQNEYLAARIHRPRGPPFPRVDNI